MPRRSARHKPASPPREASTRQRRLTTKKQALLDHQSYNPQVDAYQQSEDEQSQNEHHSSSSSSPLSQQLPPSNMSKHNNHPQEDAIIDHTSDSSDTEEVDVIRYQGQDAYHTASEHAPSLLLLSSPRTPHPSEPPSSPAPSQLPEPKAPRRYKKISRAKAAPKQAKAKPATQKRTTTKRKVKELVRSTKRQKKKVRFVDNPDDSDGNDDDDDTDDAPGPHMGQEMLMPMPMQMPPHHSAFLPPYMMPPYPHPPFHPDTTAYHPSMTYYDVVSARDTLLLQYQVAAREAFERDEQWGHLWNQSSLMEQRAASVLVEFTFLTRLAPLVPVPPSADVLYLSQSHPHGHCDGSAECCYETWP